MKSFASGIVIGFAVSCAVTAASSTESHNGMFWNKLDRAVKDGYVSGYTDATRVGISKLDTLTTAGDLFHWKGSRKIIHQVRAQLSMSSLPAKEAVGRLDRLYQNQTYVELDLSSALQLMILHPISNNRTAPSDR